MRRAAIRRVKFELGIDSLEAEDLKLVSKILYKADSCDNFYEHELDYIIFAKEDVKWNAEEQMNRDEVKSIAYVSYLDFEDFIASRIKNGEDITPWFRLLKDSKLLSWWKILKETGRFPSESGIQRFY